jgi:sodium transport system ATP-binding protein
MIKQDQGYEGGQKMISVQNVSRFFTDKKKTITASKNISFEIKKGDVVGLLGENGAGKTTLLRMISAILQPSEGSIHLDGIDIHKQPMKIKGKIGVLFGSETGLYDRLTARENLTYFAKLYGLSKHETEARVDYLSVRFGMKGYLDRRVGNYSKGMRQKVTIARTLIHDPQIILFD